MSKITSQQRGIIHTLIYEKNEAILKLCTFRCSSNICRPINPKYYSELMAYLEKYPKKLIQALKKIKYIQNWDYMISLIENIDVCRPLEELYTLGNKLVNDCKENSREYHNEIAFIKNVTYERVKDDIETWYNQIEPKAKYINMMETKYLEEFLIDPELALKNFNERTSCMDYTVPLLTASKKSDI